VVGKIECRRLWHRSWPSHRLAADARRSSSVRTGARISICPVSDRYDQLIQACVVVPGIDDLTVGHRASYEHGRLWLGLSGTKRLRSARQRPTEARMIRRRRGAMIRTATGPIHGNAIRDDIAFRPKQRLNGPGQNWRSGTRLTDDLELESPQVPNQEISVR